MAANQHAIATQIYIPAHTVAISSKLFHQSEGWLCAIFSIVNSIHSSLSENDWKELGAA